MYCEKVFTRWGIVAVPVQMVREYPDAYMAVCGELLPFRVEFIAISGNLLIHALSPHFDETPEGEIPPSYDANVVLATNTVTFTKREPHKNLGQPEIVEALNDV